jgi:hypothetical protein
MHVRKEKAGASSTGHIWEHDGAVVEVPDHVGGELLLHAPAEFTDVTAEHLAHLAAAPSTEAEDLQGEDLARDEDAEAEEEQEFADEAGAPEGGDALVDDAPEQSDDADVTPDDTIPAEQTDVPESADKPKRKYTRRTPISD